MKYSAKVIIEFGDNCDVEADTERAARRKVEREIRKDYGPTAFAYVGIDLIEQEE